MTVTPFKRKLVHIQDHAVRDTRSVLDFNGGCSNAVYISTVIPDNLDVRMLVPGTNDVAYYDSTVLARHSYVFKVMNLEHLDHRGLSCKDTSKDSNKTKEEIEEENKIIEHIKGDYDTRCEVAETYYRPNKTCLFDIKMEKFKGNEKALLDVLNWCYSQDEKDLPIDLDNMFKYFAVFNILKFGKDLERVMAGKLMKFKLDHYPNTVDRICKEYVYIGDFPPDYIPPVGLKDMELPDELTINLLILPLHLYCMWDVQAWYDVIQIRKHVSHVVAKYGSKEILDYLSQAASDQDYAYAGVMTLAKIIYSD
ncbi:hypothetical protein HDU85_005911 [Gaertneriomyces sp. JEL0708]|nr:hypothetical protein HDU85_005911 [Gaertneriomyces sp. JEL0708]